MKKGKSIIVTVLVAAMLAVIDYCFYILCVPAFTILTGAFVLYGYAHWAVDFCHWMRKVEPEAKHLAPQGNEVYDWAKDEAPDQPDPKKGETFMEVLNEDI